MDVVVCVHNALDEVQACLRSVVRNSPRLGSLVVINDGSSHPTTDFLRRFRRSHEQCRLVENHTSRRYTRAANQGISHTTAETLVLLNSDTVVPPGWIERLREALDSGANVGMVGPLSNAAGYQSVPWRRDGAGDWVVNSLPRDWTVDMMDEVVQACSGRDFPRVTFLNGFCLMIDRRVIETIGGFDERLFPDGFGEEEDYCIRSRDAGLEIAVADHTYVFHAKSRSYSHDLRTELSRRGRQILMDKYGKGRVGRDSRAVRLDPSLAKMRRKIQKAVAEGT